MTPVNVIFLNFSDAEKIQSNNFYSDPFHDYLDKCRFVGLIVAVCGQTRRVRTIDLSRQYWHQITQN